jgi:hypothetical protein
MQLDRVGRPAVNTALNHGFDPSTTTAGTAKDAYNQDSTPAQWATNYAAQFAGNLAIIDALDTVCGNQLGYSATTGYATVAGALTDDKLYLNTAGTTDTSYLAVEVGALSGTANTDQGGRGLAFKVMDATYSALSGATVTNGITGNNVPFLTTFPYEAAPNELELTDAGPGDAGDAGDGG